MKDNLDFKLDLGRVAGSVLIQCSLFNCDIDTAWKEYTHPIITEQITLDEVKKYLKENVV